MTKKLRQKFKYLDNKKSFEDEFKRAFSEANSTVFSEGESPPYNLQYLIG